MKLKSQRLFFPDALLSKIRTQVLSDAAQGVRVSKNIGSLLATSTGQESMPRDADERETKDSFRFYSEALKSAELKRSMNMSTIGGGGGGGGVSTNDRTNGHMASLLTNDARSAQNRFEEQANKLGALDTLLKEERARQQKERDHLLGIDGDGIKRPKVPSSHFNSVTPVVGMRMSLSSILAHGPKPLRGVEAILARSERDRRAEENEIRLAHIQLEHRLNLQDGIRPNTAPNSTANGGVGGVGVGVHVTNNHFLVNSGLDEEFLTSVSKDVERDHTTSISSHTKRPTKRLPNMNDRSSSQSETPSYYEALHRIAATPPTNESRLLSSVYAPESFRGRPDLAITRSHASAERFGRDMEQLPPPPLKPTEWDQKIAIEEEAELDDAGDGLYLPASSDGTMAPHRAKELMGELLTSPAVPKLHSAVMRPRSHDHDSLPKAFADEFHSFSSVMKAPLTVRRVRGMIDDPSVGRSPKSFFPTAKASTPLVLLQAMPPIALDDDETPLQTPQGILAARAKEKAAEEAAAAALKANKPMDADEAYEAERQAALQALALSLDTAPRGASLDLVPLPPSGGGPSSDDFLMGTYRVAAWRKPTHRPTKSRHGRAGSHTAPSSARSHARAPSVRVEHAMPITAQIFGRSVLDKLRETREKEKEERQQAAEAKAEATPLAPLSEGVESGSNSHSSLSSSTAPFSHTEQALPSVWSDDADPAARASTAPLPPSQSARTPRPPRPPLEAPKRPRPPVRKTTEKTQQKNDPPPTHNEAHPPDTVEPTSPSKTRRPLSAVLSDPAMFGVLTPARPPRGKKEVSPPRLVASGAIVDDPDTLITPLTMVLSNTPRAQLMRAIEVKAEELARAEYEKRQAKTNTKPPKHTDMILYTPAALHVTQRLSTDDAGAALVEPDLDALGAEVGDSLVANVPKLHLPDSIPPVPPTVSSHSVDGNVRSGTEAAASGKLASSIAPLTDVLRSNDMSAMLSGLTAVSQMLPANTAARKLTELYAHFQRHLARAREYFRQESDRAERQREQQRQEQKEKLLREQAAAGVIASLTPPQATRPLLARVDSEGYISGPDRSALTLDPSVLFDASGDVSSTSRSTGRLSSRVGSSRRGGGHIGMLETQTPQQMADSIQVLAEMISKESLENEQALRVLNSYDKKQLLYLPSTLLRRAQELNALLAQRIEAAAAVHQPKHDGPATATAINKVDQPISDDDDSPSEESTASRVAHLRRMARKKAKAKFRLPPRHQVNLFASTADTTSSTNDNQSGVNNNNEHTTKMPSTHSSEKEEHRLVDSDTARRVVNAVTAANTAKPPVAHATHPLASTRSQSRPRTSHSARAPTPPSGPLPSPFMSLYTSYGLRPVSTGTGFEPIPTRVPTPTAPAMSLLEVVRYRANLERKLKQDEFVTAIGVELTNATGQTDTLDIDARLKRRIELDALEDDERRSVATLDTPSSSTMTRSGFGDESAATSARSSMRVGDMASSARVPDFGRYEPRMTAFDDADDLDVDAMLAKMAAQRLASKANATLTVTVDQQPNHTKSEATSESESTTTTTSPTDECDEQTTELLVDIRPPSAPAHETNTDI